MSDNQKPLGNENSYTPEFLESLYQKIGLTDKHLQKRLEKAITLATQAYMRNLGSKHRQLAYHEIKKELKKTVKHLDKAADSLAKVIASGNYGEEITNNLYAVIAEEKYKILHGSLPYLKNSYRTSPSQSLHFLGAIADGLENTLKNAQAPDKTIKSFAIYHWIMILSAHLEPIIGHKLETSHYYKSEQNHKGEYISKKEIGDSELLLFIIHPLDPNVTVSHMETAIKETRKERYEAPWDDYFPY